MNICFTLFVLTISIALIPKKISGQTIYEIKDFSEVYTAELIIEKGYEDEVFKKGKIAIIESKTRKQIIEIQSEELTFELNKNGIPTTNVLELPYGRQSLLIYEDFNFDGKKDLALMDGQYGCYHGPSFQVYLETDKGLMHSPEFTKLAQDYCGMFEVNHQKKTLHTMTKSGCCWHQFSTFEVINNSPQPILVIEEDATNFPFHTTTTTTLYGDKKEVVIKKTIDLQQEGITPIFTFKLVKNGKQVVVYSVNDRTLSYVLIRPDGTVEFSYPIETEYQNSDFNLNDQVNRLTFKNQEVTYQIYETSKNHTIEKVGIQVAINGKTYNLKGDINSLKGSLKHLKDTKFDNVITD